MKRFIRWIRNLLEIKYIYVFDAPGAKTVKTFSVRASTLKEARILAGAAWPTAKFLARLK